jgi:hypothetical protein
MLVYDRNLVSVSRTETQLRYREQKPRSTFGVGIGKIPFLPKFFFNFFSDFNAEKIPNNVSMHT